MTRLYIGIIIALLISGVGWFVWQYYVDTQTRIAVLTANNAKLETAQKQTQVAFDAYRENITKEIEKFKADLKKQKELNDELNINLQAVQEANKEIAKLLANTDIIKNSLADPKASEDKINVQVDNFFGAINCATDNNCVQQKR